MIPYREAMLKYGTDKPDLRNPIDIVDVTDGFFARRRDVQRLQERHQDGGVVRAIPAPGAGAQPRCFFDKLNDWARGEGAPGLGYIIFEETRSGRDCDAARGRSPIHSRAEALAARSPQGARA